MDLIYWCGLIEVDWSNRSKLGKCFRMVFIKFMTHSFGVMEMIFSLHLKNCTMRSQKLKDFLFYLFFPWSSLEIRWPFPKPFTPWYFCAVDKKASYSVFWWNVCQKRHNSRLHKMWWKLNTCSSTRTTSILIEFILAYHLSSWGQDRQQYCICWLFLATGSKKKKEKKQGLPFSRVVWEKQCFHKIYGFFDHIISGSPSFASSTKKKR